MYDPQSIVPTVSNFNRPSVRRGTRRNAAQQTQVPARPLRPPAPLFDNIPPELKLQDRWLCWRYSEKPNKQGKFGKIPYSIVGKKATYTDRKVWMPFATVVQQYRRGNYDGIGIVLGGGLVGLDEDHCLRDGEICPQALDHIRQIDSYTEISVSGDGCHTVAAGTLPAGRCRSGRHELYSKDRYFVVTGRHLAGTPVGIEWRERELRMLHRRIFGELRQLDSKQKVPAAGGTLAENPSLHASDGQQELDPNQVITRVPQFPTNSQGGGEEEGREKGDEEGLREGEEGARWELDDAIVLGALVADPVGAKYWKGDTDGMNPSRADWALAGKLAFYSRRNVEQMTRLFLRSVLYRAEKWPADPEKYVKYTMERACKRQRSVWIPSVKSRAGLAHRGRPIAPRTQQILYLAEQNPSISKAEIARRLGISAVDVRRVLSRHRPTTVKNAAMSEGGLQTRRKPVTSERSTSQTARHEAA